MVCIHLMYHDVYCQDASESGFTRTRDLPYKLSVDLFENHVKTVYDFCKQKALPLGSVVFTFDDGGKSFYKVIAPILEKYGFRGLFFISTKYIGAETFLTKDEIIKLHKSGHIIGSHAHSHEHFCTLSDLQIDDEWKYSIKILSEIVGGKITYASVPNGDVTKQVLESAYRLGIKYFYTSEPTIKVRKFDDMGVLGRYVILNNSSSEYVLSIIESKGVRFQLLFKRKVLKIVKSILGSNYIKLKNVIFKN